MSEDEVSAPFVIPEIQPQPKFNVPDFNNQKESEDKEAPEKKLEKLRVSGV